MTAQELANKCIDVAKNYKTLYVMGCPGAPFTEYNKNRYINHSNRKSREYNSKPARKKMIQAATADTFGFDCVCLIKSILWGWNGNTSKNYGGATYMSNGVPDITADAMIKVCKDISTDFSKIEVGEAVWCSGHIGIYIGDGLAVECTPTWQNKVQITACNQDKAGYNRRNWTKHGKLPYVSYSVSTAPVETKPELPRQPADLPAVGDVVTFNGTKHYVSSNSSDARTCKPGVAKVTAISSKGKHPVHLVAVTGGGSNVYGWVDTALIVRDTASVKVGAKVKVKAGAKTYIGGGLASFVYKNTYDVISIKDDRVVIGVGKAVTAAVNKKDLIVV